MKVAFALLLLASVARAQSPPPPQIAKGVKLLEVARAQKPVFLTFAPGDARKRMFVVEKGGRIRVIENGILSAENLFDISDKVSRASEQGLLGLAFHPTKFGRLYVNYTDNDGDTRVFEYRMNQRVDMSSARELIRVSQPYSNHNGGHLAFGPDGKLWIGLGDGGAAYDPHGNGQNPRALLGKMFLLDVDAEKPQPKILHIGLRNPWRYAFDKKTQDLYIADVGQDRWEEVDVVRADSPPLNFGWSPMEGAHCTRGSSCRREGMTLPVVEYDHRVGCSITGGYVYRGRALPELDGIYFYADYCTAALRSFRYDDGGAIDHWDWKRALDREHKLANLSSFGEDADGELYLMSLDGPIYKFVRK